MMNRLFILSLSLLSALVTSGVAATHHVGIEPGERGRQAMAIPTAVRLFEVTHVAE